MIFHEGADPYRVSFEVGTYELGGHALFLSPRDVQLGRGEPIADTARVLSRYVDGIMIRTFAPGCRGAGSIRRRAVINGLTIFSIPARSSRTSSPSAASGSYEGKKVAWIGDGNTWRTPGSTRRTGSASSSAIASLRVRAGRSSPRARQGTCEDHAHPRSQEAIEGAHVVNTTCGRAWGRRTSRRSASGISRLHRERRPDERAADDAIFLHCLPAHRGEEVTATSSTVHRVECGTRRRIVCTSRRPIMAVLMGGESLD